MINVYFPCIPMYFWLLVVAGLNLRPDLQSQEGNRSLGFYSSKYGTQVRAVGIPTFYFQVNLSIKEM